LFFDENKALVICAVMALFIEKRFQCLKCSIHRFIACCKNFFAELVIDGILPVVIILVVVVCLQDISYQKAD